MRVLVVDHDLDTVQITAKLLELGGYDTAIARTGPAALEIIPRCSATLSCSTSSCR